LIQWDRSVRSALRLEKHRKKRSNMTAERVMKMLQAESQPRELLAPTTSS
jgi:hypothetical protein